MRGVERVRIVVIGGGHAGVTVAQGLADAASVKLVERKSYYEANWAAVRAPLEPELGESSVIPFEDIPKLEHVHAEAVDLDPHTVKLSTGRDLIYDYLVLCMGFEYRDARVYCSSGTVQTRRATFESAHRQLKSATTVLIIGGGPTGVEMAAEIASHDTSKGKNVTLVSGSERLMASQPEQMGKGALRTLKRMKVKVILGDRVEENTTDEGPYRLAKGGTVLQADIAFWCIGQRPSSNWLKPKHSSILNERGLIKVNERFQVEGHANWFAIGDCNDIPEVKQGVQAKLQALELRKTLLSIAKVGAERAQWTVHKPYGGQRVTMVTLGKKDAVMQVQGRMMPRWLPTWLKSKDLYVGKTRKDVGVDKGCSCL